MTTYTLTPGTVTVNENAGTVTFTVTRSGGTPAETIYATTLYGASAGYATNNGDYAGKLNQAISFSSGQTSATVTVAITNDTVPESDETFGIVVQRNTSDPASTYLAKASFTIHDDDVVTPTTYALTPGAVTVNENAGTATFTVTRSGGTPAETIYATTLYGASAGYATNNGDYTGKLNQAISFSSGQTSATVTVSITNDTAPEADETFGIIVQRNTSDSASTYLAKASFTIHDDDAVTPTNYAMSPGSVTVNENAGTVTFTVTRSGGTPAETIYATTLYGASAGYATNNGDYAGKLNQAISFSSGQTSATVTVAITNDTVPESDETFGIVVQRNTADPASTYLAKASFSIHDDDQSQATAYAISPGSLVVNEGAGTATFTITRSGILSAETIYASTVQSKGSVNSNDYTPVVNQALMFSSGQASQTVTISITNDSVAESDEGFALVVQRRTGDPANTYLAKAVFTIADNDATTIDDYVASVATTGAINVGGTAHGNIEWLEDTDWFGITLSAGVAYQFDLDGSASGQGTLADPFIRLRDGNGVAIPNAYSDDGGVGYDPRFHYTPTSSGLYYLSAGTGFHMVGTGTYTLHATQSVTSQGTGYAITPYPASVTEGNTPLTLTVTRSGAIPAETLYVSTVFGKANGFADNTGDSDYIGLKNSALIFAAGQISQTVTVQINDDTAVEGNEIFGIVVQRSQADLASTYLAHSTFTIVDNEQPLTDYWISPTPATVTEGTPSLTLTVHRSGGTPAETLYVSTATRSGGPTNSGDYSEIANQPLVFEQGQSEQTFNVGIWNDSVPENSETFAVVLKSSPGSNPILQSNFTIHDDDKLVGLISTSDVLQQGTLKFLGQFAYDAYNLSTFPTKLNIGPPANFGSDVPGYDKGVFQSYNAGALVGRSDDALFISFTGTELWTPDVTNWLEREDHYALFASLIGGIERYVSDPTNGIKHVYVTGHSLGGSMAQQFMALHPDTAAINYQAITFANPGYGEGLFGLSFSDKDDPRISNIYISGDVIRWADAISTVRGDKYIVRHDGILPPIGLHSPSLYRDVAAELQKSGYFPVAHDVNNGRVDTVNVDLSITYQNGEFTVGPVFELPQTGSLYVFTDSSGIQTAAFNIAGTTPTTINLSNGSISSLAVGQWAAIGLATPVLTTILLGVAVENVVAKASTGLLNIIGSAFKNFLQGGRDDYIYGGGGDDTIDIGVGDGNDTYDGGDDIDTLTYASTSQGVVVNLSLLRNQATGPEIATDQISNIENVIGGSGDDRITGDAAANVLQGRGGNDTLVGDGTSTGPQTVTLQPGPEGQDIWITNVYSYNDNYGVDSDRLKVGGWGDYYDSLLKFDLSGSGLPAQVSSATMRLYNVDNNGGSAVGMYVDELHTAWTESYGWHDYSLAYTNIGTVAAAGIGWVNIDVTTAVNDWLANPSSNFGLQLRPTSINNDFNFFVSSDAVGDFVQLRPELVLTIAGVGSTGIANGDVLDGGDRDDVLRGGVGDDRLIGGSGRNTIDGGGGFNTAVYAGASSSYAISVTAGTVSVRGLSSDDTLINVQSLSFADGIAAVTADGIGAVVSTDTVAPAGPSTGATLGTASATGSIVNDDATLSIGATITPPPSTPNLSATLVVGPSQLTPGLAAAVIPNGRMGSEWHTTGAADVSGNGKGVMVWQNGSGQVSEWIMNGTSLAGVATSDGRMGAEWRIVAMADFNNDGRTDLAWQNHTGQLAVWLMNGAALTGVGIPTGRMGSEWQVAGAGDLNGDGCADTVWANGQGQVAVWQINGTVLAAATISTGRMGAEWQLVGTGDFGGDGKTDLLWANHAGQVAIWTMNGANPTGVAVSAGRNGTEWHVAAVSDFDRDGRADILWQNTIGQAQLWFMQGDNVTRAVPLDGRMGTEWAIVGARDLSGAGTPDIIWANSAGQVAVWDLEATDIMAGGGIYRTFAFERLADAGKEIVDFHAGAGGDVLDLRGLLTSLGYQGASPLTDGELRLVQDGSDTHVQIDARPGMHSYVTVATLDNVAVGSLQPGNWNS